LAVSKILAECANGPLTRTAAMLSIGISTNKSDDELSVQ